MAEKDKAEVEVDHDCHDHCLCEHPPQAHELTPDHELPEARGGVARAPRKAKETA